MQALLPLPAYCSTLHYCNCARLLLPRPVGKQHTKQNRTVQYARLQHRGLHNSTVQQSRLQCSTWAVLQYSADRLERCYRRCNILSVLTRPSPLLRKHMLRLGLCIPLLRQLCILLVTHGQTSALLTPCFWRMSKRSRNTCKHACEQTWNERIVIL